MLAEAMIAFSISSVIASDFQTSSSFRPTSQIVRGVGELYSADFSRSYIADSPWESMLGLMSTKCADEDTIVDLRLGSITKKSYKIHARIRSVAKADSTIIIE